MFFPMSRQRPIFGAERWSPQFFGQPALYAPLREPTNAGGRQQNLGSRGVWGGAAGTGRATASVRGLGPVDRGHSFPGQPAGAGYYNFGTLGSGGTGLTVAFSIYCPQIAVPAWYDLVFGNRYNNHGFDVIRYGVTTYPTLKGRILFQVAHSGGNMSIVPDDVRQGAELGGTPRPAHYLFSVDNGKLTACTIDGARPKDYLTFTETGPGSFSNQTEPLYLGWEYLWQSNGHFRGFLSEVVVLYRSVSQQEAADYYNWLFDRPRSGMFLVPAASGGYPALRRMQRMRSAA